MSFLLSHSYLGFDIWAILALLLCIAIGVYWYFGIRKLKKEKKELEDAQKSAYDTEGESAET